MDDSANNLTDCVAGPASVLCAVYVVHVRTRAEAQKYQAPILMYHSDFRYSHNSRAIL